MTIRKSHRFFSSVLMMGAMTIGSCTRSSQVPSSPASASASLTADTLPSQPEPATASAGSTTATPSQPAEPSSSDNNPLTPLPADTHSSTPSMSPSHASTAQTATPEAPSVSVTTINHRATWRKLLGHHMLSLQWLGWNRLGKATVNDLNGLLHIKGEVFRSNHDGGDAGKDDFLSIEGVITQVDQDAFRFEGTIRTKVYHLNDSNVCERSGNMVFARKPGKKYWRMKEVQNPCDNVVDYIDLFF